MIADTRERELEALEARKAQLLAEQAEWLSMNAPKRVAEELHAWLCQTDHDENCSWFHEDWNHASEHGQRRYYYRKAEHLISVAVSEDRAMSVIRALRS